MNVHQLVSEVVAAGEYSKLVSAIPYLEFLGLRVERRGERVVGVMPLADHLIGNPTIPALHGGALGGLLESMAHLECLVSQRDLSKLPKTVTFTVDYLRSGRAKDTFVAARVVKAGRRISTVHASAWQEDEAQPIATARVVLKVG